MNIKEFKNSVISGTLSDDFIILLCSDNKFLANQYVNTLCQTKDLVRVDVDSLSGIQDTALSLVFNSNLYNLNVLSVDKLSEMYYDYSSLKNYIVICNSIDKSISNLVASYVIEMPKLEEWQIKDYEKTMCPGLSSGDIDFLYGVTGGDIYRISNECNKLANLPAQKQSEALRLQASSKYSDLYFIDSFSLSNLLINKSFTDISEYLRHKDVCDISPIGLVGLLIGNIKKILYVNFNSGLSAEQLGITQKQYNAIKYYNKDKSEQSLVKSLAFLTELDSKLKLGKLDLSNDKFIDYIICNMFSIL